MIENFVLIKDVTILFIVYQRVDNFFIYQAKCINIYFGSRVSHIGKEKVSSTLLG